MTGFSVNRYSAVTPEMSLIITSDHMKSSALAPPRRAPASNSSARRSRYCGRREPVTGWGRTSTSIPRSWSDGMAAINWGTTSGSEQ